MKDMVFLNVLLPPLLAVQCPYVLTTFSLCDAHLSKTPQPLTLSPLVLVVQKVAAHSALRAENNQSRGAPQQPCAG